MVDRRSCHVCDNEQGERDEDKEGPDVVNDGPDAHDGQYGAALQFCGFKKAV